MSLPHNYPFDPSYGYSLDQLKRVPTPPEPDDFAPFWRSRAEAAMAISTRPQLHDTGLTKNGWRVFDWSCESTGKIKLGGWLLLPERGAIRQGFIVGHGYGGREGPDFHLPFRDAAILFPCCRGISRSKQAPYSDDPQWHVIHDIDKPENYVLGGCVEDIWTATSSLIRLFPDVTGHLGFLGISFSGGIGAMALPWDPRIAKAHFNVPSFGNQTLRMQLPTVGSGDAVQRYFRKNAAAALNTLTYHDAAIAARHINIPIHCACARFDPSVAPPGQFAIYNAIPEKKSLYVLDAGHHTYPRQSQQEAELLKELDRFFADAQPDA